MIDRFLGDAFVVSSGQFWSTVPKCGARLPIYSIPSTTGPCSQWCRFLTRGVSVCDIVHRRSVAVLCMLYIIYTIHSTRGCIGLQCIQ